MTEYSFYTGPSPEGGTWCPTPHLKSVLPISCLAPRLLHTSNFVLKKYPPLVVFGPPPAKSWRRAWFYNCITYRNAKTRQSICSKLFVRIPIVLPVQKYNRNRTFRSDRFGLAVSVWPIRSGRFGLSRFGLSRFGLGRFCHGTFWSGRFGLGHFDHDISVHKQFITCVYLNYYRQAKCRSI